MWTQYFYIWLKKKAFWPYLFKDLRLYLFRLRFLHLQIWVICIYSMFFVYIKVMPCYVYFVLCPYRWPFWYMEVMISCRNQHQTWVNYLRWDLNQTEDSSWNAYLPSWKRVVNQSRPCQLSAKLPWISTSSTTVLERKVDLKRYWWVSMVRCSSVAQIFFFFLRKNGCLKRL